MCFVPSVKLNSIWILSQSLSIVDVARHSLLVGRLQAPYLCLTWAEGCQSCGPCPLWPVKLHWCPSGMWNWSAWGVAEGILPALLSCPLPPLRWSVGTTDRCTWQPGQGLGKQLRELRGDALSSSQLLAHTVAARGLVPYWCYGPIWHRFSWCEDEEMALGGKGRT